MKATNIKCKLSENRTIKIIVKKLLNRLQSFPFKCYPRSSVLHRTSLLFRFFGNSGVYVATFSHPNAMRC